MLYNAEAVSAILCILYQVNLTVIIRVLCNVSREIEIVAWKPMSLLSFLIDFRYDMTSLIKTIHIYGPSFFTWISIRVCQILFAQHFFFSPLHIKYIGIHWWFNQEMVLHNLTNKQNMFCGLFAVVMNNVCYLDFIRFFHLKMQLWQM